MKHSVIYSLFALALATPMAQAAKESATPKDPALVNHERILYWLEKRGEIKANASESEKELAVKQYLGNSLSIRPKQPALVVNSLKQKRQSVIKGVTTEQKTINNKTVKVLAVLIDFPDLAHDDNQLSSDDTDMFYSSYPVSHYQNLMFSPSGFTGPSGQNLESGYNFYQDESGGTFYFEGTTYGWVTADNNAAHYGENDVDTENDKNVTALVKEAVTKAVQEHGINLADYDLEDPYDLDGDGNIAEADGLIDHVMIYHSSVGEEAGGGVLGDDAIWSHRFFVDGQQGGYPIPGTSKNLFGYTIQPIDAATGVVVHEFGHDLGLPDEYDIDGSEEGSPVGIWSVMASGSWVGSPAGTKPTGFSPYARSFLQATYGGNWIDELAVNLDELMGASQDVDLVEASDHSGTYNQIRVDLPAPLLDFMPPYTGSYQYYSGKGDMKSNSMSFTVDLPTTGTLELSMKAHWDIEVDWDYLLVKANGNALAGNHTKVTNSEHPSVTNFITGTSLDVAGAEGTEGWVNLIFDVTAYAGQSVTFSLNYETDQSVGGYGFVADDIAVKQSSATIYTDGAETDNAVTMDGFSRASDKAPGLPQNYWIQLRSHNGRDAGFDNTFNSPGVLVWFSNENYSDNKVGDTEDGHPGYGFTGVVDADQNIIMDGSNPGSTLTQIRDAAFSIYNQKSTSSDNHLSANPVFYDSNDYSSPEQPASGLVLPEHGFKMEVIELASNSSTATVKLSVAPLELTAGFEYQRNFREVSFINQTAGGTPDYTYEWDFGDGSAISSEQSPVHTYATSGSYTVTLTVTDQDSTVTQTEKEVTIAEELSVDFNETISNASIDLQAVIAGGVEDYTVEWDFGDGNQGTGGSVNHSYGLTGTYTISMTVTSDDNQQAQTSKQVSIVAPLNVNFTSNRNNLTVAFSSTATGGDGSYTYEWDFGDGSSSTAKEPSHDYSEAGTYDVTFKATDGAGVEKEITKSVTVTSPPSSGGGGGSINWLLLMLLGLVLYRRR
ncbi:immune inhibitor A domain-containing protein [Kangiella koreensis]|uniref:M6 family metalloprotease domain protein n=1 Tax=Kangiella koreensis (strain DSM 16069 / JCM 12317 / KCTC 12182 / SW-125) TaxID=523791 RepID=C7R5Q0_KANKD|nr:immune inhibitor A domain-containing protein [Kangiella koreensis]ACV27224.1 M6 family metalloprotease domain protein [Kangiella koreensis DSM 16069]